MRTSEHNYQSEKAHRDANEPQFQFLTFNEHFRISIDNAIYDCSLNVQILDVSILFGFGTFF